MSGDRGTHDPRSDAPLTTWGVTAEHAAHPTTQALPQQVPEPGHSSPTRTPRDASTRQMVLLTLVSIVCAGALVFFLLVVFDVIGGNDPDPVETIDRSIAPTVGAASRVPAIAQTIFRCPEGAIGSPTIDDPNCVLAESTELVDAVEVEETVHRCPAGATGSPNEARPECAATSSGAVPAIATTTLRCPQGSIGTPTPSDPTCVAAQQVRVPVEQSATFECPEDEELDGAADPPQCLRVETDLVEIPAEGEVVHECDAGSELVPGDPPGCLVMVTTNPDCADPAPVDSTWVCLGGLTESVAATEPCPGSSAADPARPAAESDTTDCYLIVGAACETGATYDGGRCGTPMTSEAREVDGRSCPDGAELVGDRCRVTSREEIRTPATESIEYRCPSGARGRADGPQSICVTDRDVEVAALAITTYSCPTGSTGAPTTASPTCTSSTTETVPAIIATEIAFDCPDGTVGEPTEADPTCARTTGAVTVPASIVTEFSCPLGASGRPTVIDPFCEATENG